MAVATRNLSVTKSAYVKASTPYTHYGTNPSTAYLVSGAQSAADDSCLLFGLQPMPDSLRRNKLYCVRIMSDLCLGYGFLYFYAIPDFNADTVTYSTMPEPTGTVYIKNYGDVSEMGTWVQAYNPSGVDVTGGTRAQQAASLLQQAGFYVTNNKSTSVNPNWYMKAALRNGDPVYVEVTYDDSILVTSATRWVSYPRGTVDSMAAQSFSWEYHKAGSGYCVDETWEQASAVLHWKSSAEDTWHDISIAGSDLSCTVPSGTFPSGRTITCYLTGTDTDGTATDTPEITFSTATPGIGITKCPSGNSYDTRQGSVFAWTYGTSFGELEQASANLFWRESEGSWNTVSVSGNTKTLTIPGNTFPTGKTIEWYMTVTGTDGYVATKTLSSFATASSAIVATIYPSGRNIESGQPLNFAWAFRNSFGDYAQSAASLFWRASTSDPWQEIQASGGTQSLTVPKNTFPGNESTVTWYLVGTDIGGTTTQTREQTFTTVKSQITPQSSPTSGYADPRNAITFGWYFATPTASYDQASAVFHWRLSGDETWTDVQASGSTQSVTLPANTFPVNSEIEWYISGTDAGGCSSQSEVYTINTIASTAYAICLTPVGRVEDGTRAITFRWMVQNSDGTAPTRMLLWWKLPTEAQSAWHQLLDTTDEVYEFTVPPETYDAGPVQWRVQAYNRDDVAGPVNEASFVVLRAPDAPQGLSATAVPRTTISWQSSGQEAFEISIDGEIVAAEYGPATYSWQVPEPLADGVHHIQVRIQGAYGLWSNYAATSIQVENVPAGTLELAATFGTDAELQISAEIEEDTEVQWYRDEKRIGRTVGKTAFTDRFALGLHRYHAEIWQADGNYTRSNTVTGTMSVRWPMIADASGGAWISLKLSENSRREQSFSWSNETSATHIHGRTYPVMELSPYENLSGSYDGSFRTAEEAAAFEQLRRKVVVLKSPGGRVIVGGLVQLKAKDSLFYYTYSFSLQQSDGWEDFVDDEGN